MGKGAIKSFIKQFLNFWGSNLKEITGLITAIGLILSVFVAWQKLGQYADQREENNFRSIIEKLSNKDPDIRTAAATSMGTFIGRDKSIGRNKSIIDILPTIGNAKKFENEAIDILSNRLLIETDYSVSNAIRTGLTNVTDKRKMFDKLLKLEQLHVNRNNILESLLKEPYSLDYVVDSVLYGNHLKYRVQSVKNYDQSVINRLMVSDILGVYLQLLSNDTAISDLQVYKNEFNFCVFRKLKIDKSYITHSSISNANLDSCDIKNSVIANTLFIRSNIYISTFMFNTINECVFDFARLISVSFEGSKFRNVFFIGADVTNTNFRGVEGLQLENFYGAKNLEKAKFDSAFRKLLFDSLKYIDAEDVKKFVNLQPELLMTRWRDINRDADTVQERLRNQSIIK